MTTTTERARRTHASSADELRNVTAAVRLQFTWFGTGGVMQLVILPDGSIPCVYGEEIELSSLGRLDIRRASHVEPNDAGDWLAKLSPINGPVLGPFPQRSTALQAEATWIEANVLMP